MKKIKTFSKIFLIIIFLTACKTSLKKDYPIINSEENNNENENLKTKKMEVRFSCGEKGLSEYLDDGWKIIKEDINRYFTIENESVYFSILPTATQYARNSFFAGLTPLEIKKQFPN